MQLKGGGFDAIFDFPLAFNASNFVFMFVLTFFADKINAITRIKWSYFANVIVSLSFPIVSQYLSYDAAYGLDMFILVLFGKPATFRITI